MRFGEPENLSPTAMWGFFILSLTCNYEYEAKLYSRVKELSFDIPITGSGNFDISQQQKISAAYKKFEVLKQAIGELGAWVSDARIKD